MRRAFTMIELVFTLVILSIVAYVATGLIAKTFIGYNQVESQHKANLKVEIALNSIANRLSYAIGGTIVKRDLDNNNSYAPTTKITEINQAPADYEVLEWVGYDVDGFVATGNQVALLGFAKMPAWSGFCNISASSANSIATPGSNLGLASDVIANLSRSSIPKADNLKNVALFFPGNYDYKHIGYDMPTVGDRNTSGVAIVDNIEFHPSKFKLQNNPSISGNLGIKRVTEHYKLAWSAYAVVPVHFRKDATNSGEDIFDLKLVYNFRPWVGANNDYNSNVDTTDIETHGRPVHESLLITNVTVFKTYATENRVHIKLCVKEMFNATSKTSICKEKVVFR